MRLSNYTLRYLTIALLFIIAIWATLFYAVITEEVYDNIDDGLKNSKLLIIREAYANQKVLETRQFGINQYKVAPLPKGRLYDFSDKFISTFEFMEYDNDNEPVRLLETVFNDANGNPYKLTIRASMVEEDELLEDLLTALVALYFMLVISIAIINRVILKKAWKPFYSTLSKLKGFKLGTGHTFKAPDSHISEFRTLGQELEDLLQRNEAIYASQKQFIENASHELQTPLAISLNKLELFADNHDLTEAQMTELGRIGDTLNRLVRLNKSLLLLSKIENRQYADEEAVNFNELVAQLAEDYADLTEFKNISISISEDSQLSFIMNRGLATTLVSNLLKNAIVHNYAGGNVNFYIIENGFSISNTGNGRPLDTANVFKRFYRESDSEQSTGLGLSIVNSIISNYEIKADYSFSGLHTFTVTFPEKR